MAAPFGLVLESALKVPGIVMALFVDASGHAIEGAARTEADLAAAARSARGILQGWAWVGSELGIGSVRSVLIERSAGAVTISPLAADSALVLVGTRSCPPGRLRRETRLTATMMAERMAVAAGSGEPVHPQAATTGGPGLSAGRVTAAEVVLVGAHTFRLVTKLVTRLLETKGVRSSRLRAYSPASTIIDLLLDEGATLAAIGRNCLGEFLIEPVTDGPSRLVLKPAQPPLGTPTAIGSPG